MQRGSLRDEVLKRVTCAVMQARYQLSYQGPLRLHRSTSCKGTTGGYPVQESP